MKVFGIGLNRTGTTTLGACLKQFGFNHISLDRISFENYKKQEFDPIFDRIEEFDSFEDWPWPLIYKEVDNLFPDSKFILTIRKTPETWFESLCRHADYTGPTDYRKYIYGYPMPHDRKQHHLDYYLKHIKDVTDYFKNKPEKLLTICWENGDGWEKLSPFLGFECPDFQLPHKNNNR